MAAAVRDFLADSTGDLAVVNGDFAVVADAAAVPQSIACRVKMILTEYWLDEDVGVDWFGAILVKAPDLYVVRDELRAAIVDTPDVTDVVGVIPTLSSDRVASISYTVRTAYSVQPVTGTVEGP